MSETGNISDERGNGKGKAKPKGRDILFLDLRPTHLTYTAAEESDFVMNGNGKRKRVGLYQGPQTRRTEKYIVSLSLAPHRYRPTKNQKRER